MSFKPQMNRSLLILALFVCAISMSTRSALAQSELPANDQSATKTVKQMLEARQAARSEEVAVRDNLYAYLSVYLIEPKFRNENNLKQARALEIDEPLDVIPHFRPWFSFMYEELNETKEIRDQYESLLAGNATPEKIPAVKRWLEEASPAMDAISQAVVKSKHCYVELKLEELLIREYGFKRFVSSEINQLMEAFRARAMYALASEKVDTAVSDCITADRILKLSFQLNHHEVIDDASREGYGNHAVLRQLLESGKLTDKHLKELAEQWSSKGQGLSPAAVFDQWERHLLIDYFERVTAGQKDLSAEMVKIFSFGGPVTEKQIEGWDWMVTHQLMDTDLAIAQVHKRYDELVDVLTRADEFPEAVKTLKQADQTMRGRMRSMQVLIQAYEEQTIPAGMTSKQYTEQIIDGMLALLMHPNRVLDGPVDQAQYKTIQAFGNTMIAITHYRLDKGTCPERIEQLVPAYLEQSPADPYMPEQAIQFKLETKAGAIHITLRSVGIDPDIPEDGPTSNLAFEQ